MIADSHAHLDAPQFDADRAEVIRRCQANHLEAVISCGTTLESSEKNVTLAGEFSMVYATVGIHPHEAYQMEAESLPKLKELAQEPRVVAIGETGLDYHYNFSLPEVQRKSFQLHIRLARELGLPLVIHCRNAEADLLKLLEEEKAGETGGVVHCFTGSLETARRCADLGFFLGVSGIITFKNAKALAEVFKEIPLERLLVETDSPYLAPEPHRGHRNEPSFVLNTALMLAQLKSVQVDELQRVTTESCKKLFRLEP